MGNELAVGYVSIAAETSKLGAQIAREFSGVERAAVGYGRGIGAALTRGVKAAPVVDVKDLEASFRTAEASRAALVRKSSNEIDALRRKEAIAASTLADVEVKQAAAITKARDAVAQAEKRYGVTSDEARAARERLTAVEKTSGANSTAMLRAKDNLALASNRVALAEAKQASAIEQADKRIASAKSALDQFATSGPKASGALSLVARAATQTGSTVKKFATGDMKGAFGDIGRTAKAAATGMVSPFTSAASKVSGTFRSVASTAATSGKQIGATFSKIAKGDVEGAFNDMRNGAARGVSGIAAAFGRVKGVFSGLRGTGASSGSETGKAFSSALGSEMSAGASKGASLFKSVLGANLAAAGITKLLGGVKGAITSAFGGGFDRVMNIQQAEIKLSTLARAAGLTGKAVTDSVKKSMGSVSEAVDGTKFAISDAADMASQLGASNISAGKDMTRWLSITADAAQFQNREFSDMQRIIGKVAAEGRVTGETFNEMPLAAAALAKSLGKPQAEVRKLASQGKISAEQFATAMEQMIGGAAKNAGASFTSLRDNIKTAMNASMANVIKPVTDAAMPIMQAGLGLVKMFRDQVSKPLGASLGEFLQPKAEGFAKSLGKLPAVIAGFGGVVSGVMGKLSPIFDGVKAAFDGFLQGFGGLGSLQADFAPLLALATGPLGILKSTLVGLAQGIDFGALGETLGSALKPIAAAAVDLSTTLSGTLLTALQQIMPVVADAAATILPMLGQAFLQIVPLVGQMITAVAPLVTQLVGQLVPVFTQLISSVLPPVVALITQLVPVIMQVVAAVVPLVSQLAGALVPVISSVIGAVAPLIAQLVSGLAPIITMIVTTVLPPLVSVLTSVVGVISSVVVPVITVLAQIIGGVLGGAISALLPVVQVVFGALSGIIGGALSIVSGIINAVLGVVNSNWGAAWGKVTSTLSAAWSAIKGAVSAGISAVVGFVSSLPGKASAALGSFGSKISAVASAGWALLTGAITKGVSAAVELVRGLPGKASSALGGIGSKLLSAGQDLVSGFVDGIKNGLKWVTDAARNLAVTAVRAAKSALGIHSPSRVFRDQVGKQVSAGIAEGIGAGQEKMQSALTKSLDTLTKAGEDAVKVEAKRLIEARRVANAKITAANKALAKQRDAKMAAANKLSSSKARAAAKKSVTSWYNARKKDSLGTLSSAEAEKQAVKNTASFVAQTKKAQALVKAQNQLSKALWNDGTYSGAVARWAGLSNTTTKLLSALDANGKLRSGIATSIKNATLTDIARAQEQITGALDAAKATLKEMTDASTQLAGQISSSLQGELDLGSTVVGGTATTEKVMSVVSGVASRLKAFAGLLKDLVAKGIPSGLTQEVASLGSTKGAAVARALLSADATQTKTITDDWVSIGSWATSAGQTVADSMYKVGIDAQAGLVAGLEADSASLAAAAKRMADTLEKELKKALGIKSPSRRIRDAIGRFVPLGAAAGMDDELGSVRGAADRLADAAVPAWHDSTLRSGAVAAGAIGSGSASDRSSVDLTPATIQALAGLIAQLLVSGLWPAARAADLVNDLASNGSSRRRRGLAGGMV